MNEKIKAISKAIATTIIGGYAFQLLFAGFGMLFGGFWRPEFFIPNAVLISIAGGWIFWFAALFYGAISKKMWIKITARGMAIFVPFVIVTMTISIIFGYYWSEAKFWIAVIVITLIIIWRIWGTVTYLDELIEKQD